MYDTQPACATCPASFRKYHEWRARNQVFAAIGGSTPASLVLTGHGDPERVRRPGDDRVARGRAADSRRRSDAGTPTPRDQAGGPKVVVLSHRVLDAADEPRRPGGRAHAASSTASRYEIVGVMPERFALRNAELFVPLQRRLDPADRAHFLSIVARLKKGVTLERATTEMRALGQTLAPEFAQNHGIDVRSLYEVTVGNIRTPLRVLLGAVFLVLLIACANVANLLLASGLARRRELAIRLALGAGRGDLARQLTTEALVLAAAGGAFGLLLASWAVRTFVVARRERAPARRDGADRRPRDGVHGRACRCSSASCAVSGRCCGCARGSSRTPCARAIRAPAAEPAARSATASSSRRLRWRTRCSSAPGCW